MSHPSTLVLIGTERKVLNNGQASGLQSQLRQSLVVDLRIRKDPKTKKIDNSIKVQLPNVEVMVEGFQLQILQKFIEQLNDFQMLYSRAMTSLRQQDKTLYKLISL